MRKIKETLRLHFDAALSNEAISRSLNISKGTVFNTLHRFKKTGLAWPLALDITESNLIDAIYPPIKNNSDTNILKTKPDLTYLEKESHRKHVTLQLLYDEFKGEHPTGIGRSVFYDNFKEHLGKNDLKMHIAYKGGDKLFIDYSGDSLSYIDRATGDIKSTQMFVSSWGASSHSYTEFTCTQSKEDWVNSHVRMQEYYGCVPGALVPDNLKSGVIKPSWYEPDLNPLYYEMAKHYDTCVLPARVKEPRDKAVVESNVLHLQRYILGRLRNRTFFSLEEINHVARELLEEFNNRPMKEYGGQSRKQRFHELDKPFAKPLPIERFSINKMKDNVRVGPNYHVEFDSHHYSVPHALVRERVTVYNTGNLIEIYHKGEHVVRHQKQPYNSGYTTVTEHMPANHQFVKGIKPSWLIFKGGEIGPDTSEAIKAVLESRSHPEQGYKSALGILRMATKYSPERLENACKRAKYFRSTSYRNIKTILEKGLEGQPLNDEPDTLQNTSVPVHENIRGQNYYSQN